MLLGTMAHWWLSQRPATTRAVAAVRVVGLAMMAGTLLLLVRDAVHFVTTGLGAITYPFELDYGEGPILNQVRALTAGRSIYAPINDGAYTFGNYPPVFYLLTAGFGQLIGAPLAVGRALSVTSALLTAVVIGTLIWRAARVEAGPWVRALAAASGGLAFLRVSYTATWAPLMRVDMLALLLVFAGVLAFVTGARRGGAHVCWCVLPFLLALYTKQSAVAGVAACAAVALLATPRRGLALALALVGATAGVFAALMHLTHGQFYFHVVTVNNNTYDWRQAAAFLGDVLRRYPIEAAIALVSARALLTGGWAQRATPGPADFRWERPVLGTYLLTAFAVSLTVGKLGAEVNYLIEFMGVVCTCVWVAAADGFALPAPDAASTPRRALGSNLSALVLPSLLLWQVAGISHRPAIEWVEIPEEHERQDIQRLLDMMRRADGAVLSEDMTLLVLAGKPVEFQPFDMTQLAYAGLWNQSAFVRRIAARQFALIVLRFPVAAPSPLAYTRFSPDMIAAIRTNYVAMAPIAGYSVYVPLQTARNHG